ncbi:MAG: hypothetical protein ACKPJD_11510, partial [Planctomycetaceae bacterium]
FQQRLQQARQFYGRVSQELNTEPLFSEMNVLRRFQGDAERLFFLRERYESVRDLVQLQVAADGREIGFVMPVWKLNVACYLEKTREFFQKRGQFLAAELEIGTDVVPGPDAVSLPRLGLSADRLYLCLGAAGGEQANV